MKKNNKIKQKWEAPINEIKLIMETTHQDKKKLMEQLCLILHINLKDVIVHVEEWDLIKGLHPTLARAPMVSLLIMYIRKERRKFKHREAILILKIL
jgi:hypothetical protein